MAQAALDADRAGLIAIGRPFISNADLAPPDRATFHTEGRAGYVAYPARGDGAAAPVQKKVRTAETKL
jgi:2,4-dienoyl-CoA reductase-like NADH-dependent reductase (Old Yellow Enzyme family)